MTLAETIQKIVLFGFDCFRYFFKALDAILDPDLALVLLPICLLVYLAADLIYDVLDAPADEKKKGLKSFAHHGIIWTGWAAFVLDRILSSWGDRRFEWVLLVIYPTAAFILLAMLNDMYSRLIYGKKAGGEDANPGDPAA